MYLGNQIKSVYCCLASKNAPFHILFSILIATGLVTNDLTAMAPSTALAPSIDEKPIQVFTAMKNILCPSTLGQFLASKHHHGNLLGHCVDTGNVFATVLEKALDNTSNFFPLQEIASISPEMKMLGLCAAFFHDAGHLFGGEHTTEGVTFITTLDQKPQYKTTLQAMLNAGNPQIALDDGTKKIIAFLIENHHQYHNWLTGLKPADDLVRTFHYTAGQITLTREILKLLVLLCYADANAASMLQTQFWRDLVRPYPENSRRYDASYNRPFTADVLVQKTKDRGLLLVAAVPEEQPLPLPASTQGTLPPTTGLGSPAPLPLTQPAPPPPPIAPQPLQMMKDLALLNLKFPPPSIAQLEAELNELKTAISGVTDVAKKQTTLRNIQANDAFGRLKKFGLSDIEDSFTDANLTTIITNATTAKDIPFLNFLSMQLYSEYLKAIAPDDLSIKSPFLEKRWNRLNPRVQEVIFNDLKTLMDGPPTWPAFNTSLDKIISFNTAFNMAAPDTKMKIAKRLGYQYYNEIVN